MPEFVVALLLAGCLPEPIPRDCVSRTAYYPDADRDGLGEPTGLYLGCSPPTGWVTTLAPDRTPDPTGETGLPSQSGTTADTAAPTPSATTGDTGTTTETATTADTGAPTATTGDTGTPTATSTGDTGVPSDTADTSDTGP